MLSENVIMFPSTLRQNISKYTTEDNLAQMVRSSTVEDSYTIKYDDDGTLEFVIHGYYFKVSNVPTLPKKAYIVIDNNTRTLRNTTDGSTTLDNSNNFTGLQFDGSKPSATGCTTYELEISDNTGLINKLPAFYSAQVKATSPLTSSNNSIQTSILDTTISLDEGYGDTQNPFGSKTKNYVLAAPSSSNGTPEFRKLVSGDIPSLAASKITSGAFDDDRIPDLSASKITSGTLPVARGGTGASSFTANRVIMSGTSTTGAFQTRAIDTTPTSNSDSLITSGAVYSGLAGKSNSGHKHSTDDITSGTLGVARGGTGATTFTSGAALIGAGTSAITTRAIDTTSGGTSGSNSLITSGAVYSGLSGKANSSHNHSAGNITSGTLDADRIPNLSASKITSGTLPIARGGTGASSWSAARTNLHINYGTSLPSSGTNGDIFILY